MERLVHAVKVVWRSERLLLQNEIRLGARRAQLNALAGLVSIIGLVMLSLAAFFALVPPLGQALAALVVGFVDLLVAAALVWYASSLEPGPELGMIKEMRDLALTDIEEEAALAEAELMAIKKELTTFLRNPFDALLPAAIVPLLTSVVRGLGSKKD